MTFKTTVRDAKGQPIAGALVAANIENTGATYFRSTDGEGYADVALLGYDIRTGDRVTFFVLKDGYQQHVEGDALTVTAEDQVLAITLTPSFKRPARPTVVPRGPLTFPTCGSCPSPTSFDQTMLWTPPASPSRDFLRGDAWGHVPNPAYLPGGVLPFVPGLLGSGGSSRQPQRMLTGLDYKYPRACWPGMLRSYAECGYTDWLRWWPNARDDGQQSIAQFVDDCGLIKRTIPFVTVSLGAKPGPEGAPPLGDPRDQSVQQWQDRIGPILTALLAAKVVDVVIPAFEWDAFNIPGDVTIQTCTWVGRTAHAAGVNCAMHFYPEHGAWPADGEPRGRYGFWDDLGADVDYLDYQGIPAWDIGELQAHLVDWLIQFHAQGNVHKLRLREDQAETGFDEDHPTEDEGNARGFLACCTRCPTDPDGTHVWGSGAGLRDRSGSML